MIHFIDLKRGRDADSLIDEAASWLFTTFINREKEFGYSNSVTVVYPELDGYDAAFLSDPLRFIAHHHRVVEREHHTNIGSIVILTTYGSRVRNALESDGYQATRIDMPAGPDDTFVFEKHGEGLHRLYIEAVNEKDPKIVPSFVLIAQNQAGERLGGVCGSIHERNNRLYAYIVAMSVVAGAPQGLGSHISRECWAKLKVYGVCSVHLGTQTAAPFYAQQGFTPLHVLIKALRWRKTMQGDVIDHDLMIMEKIL